MKWNTYGGGTGAADGKNSYQCDTGIGLYGIDPITYSNGRHRGYVVTVANKYGKLNQPGLYRWLSDGTPNLATAKRLCREHHAEQIQTGGKTAT